MHRGLTLIELIVFMVVVSIALTGVLLAFQVAARSSSDPVARRQMLAVAEAILDEIRLRPFTWCDPDDPAASSATGISQCTASLVEQPGPEIHSATGETRLGSAIAFDNVNDYCSDAACNTPFVLNTAAGAHVGQQVTSLDGLTRLGPEISAWVELSGASSLGPAGGPEVPAGAALLITVTVARGDDRVVVQGYRTRYAPNLLP